MLVPNLKKEKSFYYKIFLAVLVIEFLNLAYLFYRHMSGDVSFYFFRLSERTIFIILSLIAMPLLYILIFLTTLVIKKTNKNLLICAGILSLSSLAFIHAQTLSANYNYKQEKRIDNMNLEYFEWEGTNNAPLGYPIDVYKGGLESKDGGYTGLSLGTSSGIHGWGAIGAGMSSDSKAVPDRLNVTWLSYAEDTFYHIDCPIDYNKMVQYFKEGFDFKGASGKIRHETYKYITVGYAPGGVAVIWLQSHSKQVEIGRYQGKKIVIDQQEINDLDYPKKLFFKQSYRDDKMNNQYIVPTAVREANKNKPLPYGLWDTYREKHLWKPTFIVQREGEIGDFQFTGFNGESEDLYHELLLDDDYKKRAIPKEIAVDWKDKEGQRYSGYIKFDEQTIFDAFKEIYKDNKDIPSEIEFRINIPNTFITVKLKAKEKESNINIGSTVRVFKIRK